MVFEDNRLIPLLYGERNSNLKAIEGLLQVEIGDRGNTLTITGSAQQAEKARQMLEALWSRVQKGVEIDAGEIDSALRFLNQHRRHNDKLADGHDIEGFSANEAAIQTRKKRIAARTPVQADYINMMRSKQLVFGMGPAGTGKTYLAVARAVEMMEAGKVERIILSRPAVEAGERLGFLPGGMEEKMDPYMRPLYDALHDTMPGAMVQKKILSADIEIAPLAFMRGRTLNNAFVILDEAQNTTPMQMLMFLTRLGESSFMVVTGDPGQIDLPKGTDSGLLEAERTLRDVPEIGFTRFTATDIVRSKMVERIIQAYDRKRP